MTAKYATETFSMEFRELQATTMSLDNTGIYAMLAGRKYLGILDLSGQSNELLVRVPYGGKYEISCTQWSNLNNSSIVAVACSQRCDIFELTDNAELKCLYKLKCHSRVITDIDWSPLQSNLLATSSFDSYVHIWDIRVPRQMAAERPQVSLPALDGASQVRWNKVKSDVIASCDGGHVKIWDMRKPTAPSEYIAAHVSRINGLEWLTGDTIVTAAQDCTVKINKLDTTVPKPKGPVLTLNTPVWRARPAPFGRGLVTQCVPVLRRDAGLLTLWDWERFSQPVLLFQANDIVEFSWKRAITCDLITWSRDQTLRVWSVLPEVVETCGENPWNNSRRPSTTAGIEAFEEGSNFDGSDDAFSNDNQNEQLDGMKRKRDKGLLQQLPPNVKRDEMLKKEVEDTKVTKSDHVSFDQIDLERGILKLSWRSEPNGRAVSAVMVASFPFSYPSAPPTFIVTNCTQDVDKPVLMKQIRQVTHQYSSKQEPCLQACVEQFATYMNLVKPSPALDDFSAFPRIGVSNVPFPRTSGARFCSAGVLVVFGRPSFLKRIKSTGDTGTPRSLASLGPFLSQLVHDNEIGKKRGRRGERKRAGLVTIFNVNSLLPFSKELASDLNCIGEPDQRKSLCIANEKKALETKCTPVSFAWQAAAIIANYANGNKFQKQLALEHGLTDSDYQEEDTEVNWIKHHPLGSPLLNKVIQHYASFGDVQTAATIASLFTNTEQVKNCTSSGPSSINIDTTHIRSEQNGRSVAPKQLQPVTSPYHTIHGSMEPHHPVIMNSLTDSLFRQHRSNSWSDSLDEVAKTGNCSHDKNQNGYNTGVAVGHCALAGLEDSSSRQNRLVSTNLLNPELLRVYDSYKKSYAEVLYRWRFLQQRNEVLKSVTDGYDTGMLVRHGLDFVNICKQCGDTSKTRFCRRCKKVVVAHCAICRLPAKGLSSYCSNCGHGGHSTHMREWFAKKRMCPAGCGCSCLDNNDL